jgi:hypothetical protein
MKQVRDLDKAGKVALLKLIRAGEIDRNELSPETYVVTDPKEAFSAVMFSASLVDGQEIQIVFSGKAEQVLRTFFSNIDEQVGNEVPVE